MPTPKDQTPERVNQAIALVAEGYSLRKACETLGMSTRTAMDRIKDDPETAQHYARAKDASADSHADRITDLAERVLSGEYDPQAARVAIDALKWVACKLKPRVYGDKVQQEISGQDGSPLSLSVVFTNPQSKE